MDNVSKALIIAAGVLIGVLLISAFMYMLTAFRDFQSTMNDAKEKREIFAFNSRFKEFVSYNEINADDTNYVLGFQIYNLIGLAIEENSKVDEMYSIKINGVEDVEALKNLRNEFYFTENLANKYKITNVEYSYGVIYNIEYAAV